MSKKKPKEEVYYVEVPLAIKARSYEQAARRAQKFFMESVTGPTRFNVARGNDSVLRFVELQEVILVGD